MSVIYLVVLDKLCHHDETHFPHLKLELGHGDLFVTFSVQSAQFLYDHMRLKHMKLPISSLF